MSPYRCSKPHVARNPAEYRADTDADTPLMENYVQVPELGDQGYRLTSKQPPTRGPVCRPDSPLTKHHLRTFRHMNLTAGLSCDPSQKARKQSNRVCNCWGVLASRVERLHTTTAAHGSDLGGSTITSPVLQPALHSINEQAKQQRGQG